MKVKAAVCNTQGADFVIEELELAEPRYGEVLVKVVAVGVCHTDAALQHNSFGLSKYPIVPGHEGSGIIEKVGPGVTNFEPGDHVVLSYPTCGLCDACASGRPWDCSMTIPLEYFGGFIDGFSPFSRNGEVISNFFGQSSFATHTVTNIRSVTKVDKSLDLRNLGPLGCGVMTGAGTVLNCFKPSPTSTIAVFGAGGVGLSAVMAAKTCNCSEIIVVDIHQSRLDAALELGATHVLNSKDIQDIPGEIKKLTGGLGVDFMVETTGKTTVADQAIDSLAAGGVGGIVAVEYTPYTIDNLFFKFLGGKTIYSIVMGWAIPQKFIPQMLKLNSMGIFPFENMMKYYKFEEINQAFADSKNGIAIKPVLIMPE